MQTFCSQSLTISSLTAWFLALFRQVNRLSLHVGGVKKWLVKEVWIAEWDGLVQRLRILEFTIDHEAPYFSKMRRRTSRKDSDLNGIVDVRYTGGARMLLLIEVGQGRWRFKVRCSNFCGGQTSFSKVQVNSMRVSAAHI